MQILYHFFPILLFFGVYKLGGIYAATVAAIIFIFTQILIHWIKHRTIEKMQLIILIIITILGGTTLVLHDPIFIKWNLI